MILALMEDKNRAIVKTNSLIVCHNPYREQSKNINKSDKSELCDLTHNTLCDRE